MKKSLLLLAAGILLLSSLGYADNVVRVERNMDLPSFLGWVQDEFIVVIKEDRAGEITRRGAASSQALGGTPELDALRAQFRVEHIKPQFPNRTLMSASNSAEKSLALHYKVRFTEGKLEAAMAAYEALDVIEHVEPIGIHTMYATPNDTYYDNPPPEFPYDQWHLWNNSSIDADLAWDVNTGDNTVVVGILDSGTRYFHVDLGGNVPQWGPANPSNTGNIFINSAEIPNNGVDDDGNGYVDDVIGYDFVATTGGTGVTCIDQDCGTADNDPDDGDGHGTHVAGTVGAITNNAIQVAGVAGGFSDGTTSGTGNGVRIAPMRIGYHASYFGQQTGIVRMDYAAEAMNYLADMIDRHGINVAAINCSWGSSNSGGLDAAVTNLINHDVVIVVAAGNSNSSSADYLGSRGDCLDVAATDRNGNGASFTNYGSWVDVAAPGVEILSTFRNPDDPDPGAHYIALLDGTSMAAPHVAGIIALLESCNPSLTGPQKFNLVVNNTTAYSDSRDLGSGIANAYQAMLAAGCTGCSVAADFSGSPTSGCASLTVNFTDLSTGGATQWNWDFGDGVGTSTAQNPSYTYSSPGTYTVSLTAGDGSCSDTETRTGYITVSAPPVANFTGSPTSGAAPLTVDFTDLSSGNPTSWSWDFGDGVGTSSAQNPSYSYNDAGTYTVALTVTSSCGSDSETKTGYITVDTASSTVQDFANADLPVSGSVSGSYTNTFSSDNSYEVITEIESGGRPQLRSTYLEHKWTVNVTGGSAVTLYVEAYRPNNADGDDFVFAYSTDNSNFTNVFTVASATEAVYSAALPSDVSGTLYIRVTDTDQASGNRDLASVYVDQLYVESNATPQPPIANFSGSPTTGTAPLTVDFTDLSSGSPATWSWDFGDGAGTSTAQNPSYTYTNVGIYSVSLTVSNAQGSDSETKVDYITVTDPSSGTEMHVSAIVVTEQQAGGPNRQAVAQVTILDQNDQPVANATVSGFFNEPNTSTFTGTTDGSGAAVITSDKTKTTGIDFCFEVTDVALTGATYNPSANVVTRACESGPVFGLGDATMTSLPAVFELNQNYPNPFNPSTEISFSLPVASTVKLEIYNIQGQRVATLVDGQLGVGTHTVKWDAAAYSSGMYLYRLTTPSLVETRKMILLK